MENELETPDDDRAVWDCEPIRCPECGAYMGIAGCPTCFDETWMGP
jgi:hypothetical protein